MAKQHGEPKGSVERVFGQLLVGTAKSMRAHDQLNLEMGFAEIELQFQSLLSGDASSVPWFTTVDVPFADYPMHFAPGQRDSELDRPHFWFGAELDAPVMVTASVVEWTNDPDNGAYIGATVQVGALAATSIPFTGRLHMTFQGWGALSEADDVG